MHMTITKKKILSLFTPLAQRKPIILDASLNIEVQILFV
jgi:hypothetical protein